MVRHLLEGVLGQAVGLEDLDDLGAGESRVVARQAGALVTGFLVRGAAMALERMSNVVAEKSTSHLRLALGS